MTANLLTLNSPETEFLLIGLSKQLAKVNNSSINSGVNPNIFLGAIEAPKSPKGVGSTMGEGAWPPPQKFFF